LQTHAVTEAMIFIWLTLVFIEMHVFVRYVKPRASRYNRFGRHDSTTTGKE